MSNGCLTIVTSVVLCGSIPFFVSAANSSGSLPQSQSPTFLPRIFAIDVDAALLPRQLGHPGAREHLSDVDEPAALVARREQVGEPVDAELGLPAGDDLLRR